MPSSPGPFCSTDQQRVCGDLIDTWVGSVSVLLVSKDYLTLNAQSFYPVFCSLAGVGAAYALLDANGCSRLVFSHLELFISSSVLPQTCDHGQPFGDAG